MNTKAETMTSDDLPGKISVVIALSSLLLGFCLALALYLELTHLFKVGTLVEMLTMGFYPSIKGDVEGYVLKHSKTLLEPFIFALSFLILMPIYIRRSIKHLTQYMLDLQEYGYTKSVFSLTLYSSTFFTKSAVMYLLAYPIILILLHVIFNGIYIVLFCIGAAGLTVFFGDAVSGLTLTTQQAVISSNLESIAGLTWAAIIKSLLPDLYMIYKGIRFGAWSMGFLGIEILLTKDREKPPVGPNIQDIETSTSS